MNSVIHIRSAAQDDAETVFGIESASFGHGWTMAQIRDELAHRDAELFLAVVNGCAVGYAAARKSPEFAELFRIAVVPGSRRSGAGSALLDAVIAWCREQNVPSLLLEVREDNAAALRLYEKKGFRVTGKRKRYYDGTTAAVLMELLL